LETNDQELYTVDAPNQNVNKNIKTLDGGNKGNDDAQRIRCICVMLMLTLESRLNETEYWRPCSLTT
jgi:hypothetical protein